MTRPELLAPAGNNEKLVTALHYGADAVYLGLSDFSLRAKADNFTPAEMETAARYVRQQKKKFYVTINIFPHNRDVAPIDDHIDFLKELKPDAIIVSDPGVFDSVAARAPEIPLHVSTQANVTNYRAAQFWEKAGAKRLILSRELTIDEIQDIGDAVSLELECFVHGAICISYSGRCYMSSYLANRSGNRGECTNTCRWNYVLQEEQRPGEYFPVYENDRGTYVMSSRDLCMIEHLDKLADAGVSSFKLEGRMKGINYLAGVVKTYREAVDSLGTTPYTVKGEWLRELSMFSSRGYTTGMFLGIHPDNGYNHTDEKAYRKSHEFIGVILGIQNGKATVALRNTLAVGDTVEFLSTGLENQLFRIDDMTNLRGQPVPSGRNDEIVHIQSRKGIRKHDLVRRPLPSS
jgi:putative protease